MSKIDEMIKKFCPNGVEYKPLISFTKVLRGRRLTKNQLSLNAPFPVFHGGLEPLGFYSEANRPANSVMIINVGASAGTVGFCDKAFWSSDGCFTLESSENNSRYLYYAILCQEGFLKSRVRKAGIPTLDSCVVEKLIIPVPPLEIQEEIVHILDKFTELTAELTARKKQYEFYRDQLLSFGKVSPPPNIWRRQRSKMDNFR
ncbi:restriction endonuclease subunit S [Fibrobacter sp. UWR3]|uniref:restriction endonuclease subunit S n=1 Tax=Fibrobacter sp. UWR3 TaxID=1896217 RepID=UPI0009FA8A1F|nr:restriction endonuclease subunit S [Fibrobacter sp. UWR3]